MPVFDPILRNWIPGVELVIRRGVHYLSFKDGAFQTVIPANPPYTQEITTKALDILLAHEFLNGNEKRTLTNTHDLYTRLLHEHGRAFTEDTIVAINNMGEKVVKTMLLSDDERQRMSDCIEALEDMFDADRSQRGIRIPSRGYQLVNDKGFATETIFFDVDGHQLCVFGDYFKDVKMEEGPDYYELQKQGPDGETLRYLTARFMVAQGCQTPEFNDLASEDTQKQEVMMYIEAKGDHAFHTPDLVVSPANAFAQNPPYEEHKLQQPIMFLQPWNVVKHYPGTKPLYAQKPESIETQDEDCEFDEDDEDCMEVENDKKSNKKNKKPPVPKFDEGQGEKKPKVSARKKVKDMGAAVGSALRDVKGCFN